MQNIQIDLILKFSHITSNVKHIHFQPATNNLFIIHNNTIDFLIYNPKNNSISFEKSLGKFQQLQEGSIIAFQQLVDDQTLFITNSNGSIFTIDKNGTVDIKAQNQDGLQAASISPTQQYFYFITNNHTLLQLNREFDLVNQIPLDSQQQLIASSPKFSWRGDGKYFVVCYQTKNGIKAVTKDLMMNDHISAAKSDPTPQGVVQSVSEKGKKNIQQIAVWQPSGSIIAGIDYVIKNANQTKRVIFWQKNGLRHLQFPLPQEVSKVKDMFWSLDSTILFINILDNKNNNYLYLYYRSNYHWYLKNTIYIGSSLYTLISSKRQKHRIAIINENNIQIVEFTNRLPKKIWKTQEEQQNNKHQYYYFVDGKILNITDLAKSLMPPPLSMVKVNFNSNISAIDKYNNHFIVLTQQTVILYNAQTNKIQLQVAQQKIKGLRSQSLKMISLQPLIFNLGKSSFKIQDKKVQQIDYIQPNKFIYEINMNQQIVQLNISYQNQILTINDNIISQQCTSFIFYHQFLLFTVSTSDMYDKLYVINIPLLPWIIQSNIKNKLKDLETKDLLNHRLVERGSRIVSISNGRVVFQLPRGNFEGIYPKVIMINLVKQYIAKKQYKNAFETIRTHKLDFNLIYDVNPEQFQSNIQQILRDIKRVDYINLIVTQVTDQLSTQLQYIFNQKQLQNAKSQFQLKLHNKKIKLICRLVAQTLRIINKDQYILSIFTSQIRQGKLNQVLFQIKDLKQSRIQILQPPHISKNNIKKKSLNPQQILQYVCWLVDANSIYQAALLTYDLQLAAMTARCTQKDPKQYLPYIESLKQIKNQIQFKKRICLDLKKYDIAVRQLSNGNEEQIKQSLSLIQKHKLYKHGLTVYNNKPHLLKVKQIIINDLIVNSQLNQAYKISQSAGFHQKALEIAVKSTQAKKIIQSLQILYKDKQQKRQKTINILNSLKEDIKNKVELARLYAYIGQYEQAVTIFLRHNHYKKAYQYLWNVSEQYRKKQMIEGFKLCFSLKKNQIIKDKKEFMQKYTRLLKVHKQKAQFGQNISMKQRQNDDMYSEVSVSSKTHSSYTISTTTGMRKKKDKKRSILSRNVKQGSLLEQQYILAYIKMLQDKVQESLKDGKILIQYLICMNLIEQAQLLRNQIKQYIDMFKTYKIKSYSKTKFEQLHPQASQLYYEQKSIYGLSIDSFNYLF